MFKSRELFGKTVEIQIPDDVFPSNEVIQEMDDVTGENCQHGWFEGSADGESTNLHYRYWLPKGAPKGIVVYTHGIMSQNGHALRLDGRPLDTALTVDTFREKGFAVYAKDQYGHGLSEGVRFFIPIWTDIRDNTVGFVKFVAGKYPTDIPLFLMGESFGGCLTIHTAKHFQDHPDEAPPNFDASLLVCPALEADVPPFPINQILRYILAPAAPKWTPFFMPNSVSPERIWKDKKVLELYQDPEKVKLGLDACGVPLRLGTAVNCLAALETAVGLIDDFSTPFCIVHGEDDAAVPIGESKHLFESSATSSDDKEFHPMPEAFHGLLAGPEAEEAMNHLSKFVDSRLKKFVAPK